MSQFDGYTEDLMRSRKLLKWEHPQASGHWVAEMDFGTAPVVEEALVKALRDGFLGYMPGWLREHTQVATANMLQRRFGWSIKPEEVSLAASVLDGLRAMLGHMLEPGSTVIVPTPAYMPFLTLPGKYGHKLVEVPSLRDEDGTWRLDFEGIERAAKDADLFLLCNPWNPTGRVLTEPELRRVGDIAIRHDLLVFNDEIHSPLVANPSDHIPYVSLDPAFADHTVTATAASKGFNLAGLQCAQMITTGGMTQRFEGVANWLNSSTPLGALGAAVAFEEGDEWLDELNRYVRANVDLMDELLADSALSWKKPEGTYLGWIDASAMGVDDPAEVFLREANVRMNAGSTLGKGYERFVRFNMSSSHDVVERSIKRMIEVAG